VETDERKRKYNSLAGTVDEAAMTPEEMEAYRIKKSRGDDPMEAFKRQGGDGQYELLE
jgi:pre-mRNA-processing factor SLU7